MQNRHTASILVSIHHNGHGEAPEPALQDPWSGHSSSSSWRMLMEESRFDRLARDVVRSGSRRALLRWASVGVVGSVLATRWPAGVAGQVVCNPGQFKQDEQCFPCAPGTFNPNVGQTSCTPCPTGQSQPLPGQISCAVCPPGTFANAAGSAACSPCPAGTAQPNSGSTSCPACPQGSNTPAGSAACGGSSGGGGGGSTNTCPANAPKVCPGSNGQAGMCCSKKRKCATDASGAAVCKKKKKR